MDNSPSKRSETTTHALKSGKYPQLCIESEMNAFCQYAVQLVSATVIAMSRLWISPAIVGLAALAMPAHSAEPVIAVSNATGADISGIEIKRVGGDQWLGVGGTSRSGQRGSIRPNHQDCAFDLRATTGSGEQLTFSRVNLCGVKLLTLQKRGATLWVDYD